ncbi:MAG: 4Fe-4S dicluster domain-containing protein [Deltaproteobacteria bacterium]|nr:4Fe-4S dicluster domain-containing protein [Deltaproteobacteria bacterium]
MGIKNINEALCTGCNICVQDCPMDVIRLNEATGKAYIAYARDCAVCYICETGCPEEAIEVSPESSWLPIILPY